MRRWCAGVFITGYLLALTTGIVSHTLSVGVTAHPIMYFLVWDMYCGWSAYDCRYRAVAEGVSGKYYDLEPTPWGPFKPYNTRDRFQYSSHTGWMSRSAAHTVAHTKHESIARIYVIEEDWAKQFNLPDYVWKARYNIPKQPYHYSHIRIEMDGTGQVVHYYPPWVQSQTEMMVADNPRLQYYIRNSRPFWMVDEHQSDGNRYFREDQPSNMTTISSPDAN